jgi:hypothetical protein
MQDKHVCARLYVVVRILGKVKLQNSATVLPVHFVLFRYVAVGP